MAASASSKAVAGGALDAPPRAVKPETRRGKAANVHERRRPPTAVASLILELRPFDVAEPLKRIGAQGEAEPGSLRGMHAAVGANVEGFIEELPHHLHVALRDLEDVAVGGRH